MRHWTGQARLPPEQAVKLMYVPSLSPPAQNTARHAPHYRPTYPSSHTYTYRGDYRVMAVLQKIKALQTACQRANIPVPLDAVLRRERSLRLPGGQPEGRRQPEGKATATAKKNEEKAEKGEEKEEGTSKETATQVVSGTPAAAAPAPAAVTATATTTTTEVAAAAVAGQRRVVRRPPQTVGEWLHLLSPLLTLVFGVLYALARAVGKQGQEGTS